MHSLQIALPAIQATAALFLATSAVALPTGPGRYADENGMVMARSSDDSNSNNNEVTMAAAAEEEDAAAAAAPFFAASNDLDELVDSEGPLLRRTPEGSTTLGFGRVQQLARRGAKTDAVLCSLFFVRCKGEETGYGG